MSEIKGLESVVVRNHKLSSKYLNREVLVDGYLPPGIENPSELPLLLVNDGQDLRTMKYENIVQDLFEKQEITPIFTVGIHCSADRKNEYGTAGVLDYLGRGTKSDVYQQFVLEELLPYIRKEYSVSSFKHKAYAGFSLGGLSAVDIVWNHPEEFSFVAAFSGSFWWRHRDQDHKDFDENTDRIMHRLIRDGNYSPWLKFFFEVGAKDETADRNNNGIIDVIDDTLDLIKELANKGYNRDNDIHYLELNEGKHDVPTWAGAFPVFLKWVWGNK